jgi:hypothetical protein
MNRFSGNFLLSGMVSQGAREDGTLSGVSGALTIVEQR